MKNIKDIIVCTIIELVLAAVLSFAIYTIYTRYKNVSNYILCPECRSEMTIQGHCDGEDFYHCDNCGKDIIIGGAR